MAQNKARGPAGATATKFFPVHDAEPQTFHGWFPSASPVSAPAELWHPHPGLARELAKPPCSLSWVWLWVDPIFAAKGLMAWSRPGAVLRHRTISVIVSDKFMRLWYWMTRKLTSWTCPISRFGWHQRRTQPAVADTMISRWFATMHESSRLMTCKSSTNHPRTMVVDTSPRRSSSLLSASSSLVINVPIFLLSSNVPSLWCSDSMPYIFACQIKTLMSSFIAFILMMSTWICSAPAKPQYAKYQVGIEELPPTFAEDVALKQRTLQDSMASMVQFKSPDQFIEQANKRIGDKISGFLRLPTSFWDQHVSSDSDAGPPPTIHGTPLTTAMASGAPKRLGTFVYPTPARRVSRSLKDLLCATNKSIVDMLTKDKILPNWKGMQCPRCQKGTLSGLIDCPGGGSLKKYCFVDRTTILFEVLRPKRNFLAQERAHARTAIC